MKEQEEWHRKRGNKRDMNGGKERKEMEIRLGRKMMGRDEKRRKEREVWDCNGGI